MDGRGIILKRNLNHFPNKHWTSKYPGWNSSHFSSVQTFISCFIGWVSLGFLKTPGGPRVKSWCRRIKFLEKWRNSRWAFTVVTRRGDYKPYKWLYKWAINCFLFFFVFTLWSYWFFGPNPLWFWSFYETIRINVWCDYDNQYLRHTYGQVCHKFQ